MTRFRTRWGGAVALAACWLATGPPAEAQFTFRSGTALLGSSTRHRADCLVVDYKMSEIDGLELAHRLRGLDVRTPIVLITGYPDENISAKAGSAGVRQVLLKPNLGMNLVDCVRTAINTRPPASQA